ncbi:cohesin domain-containing protein [Duganella sp. BuS-21]|uniref:cohesin domain-containing protein n=1 Tax=Duganella sp. BuS-21 TaxID=2943848 RepID=UPI0035A67D41
MRQLMTIRFCIFHAVLLLCVLLSGCEASLKHRDGMIAMERRDYVAAVKQLAEATEMKPGDHEYRKDWLRGRELATGKLLEEANNAVLDQKIPQAERAYRAVLAYDRDNARALAGLEKLERIGRANDEAAQAAEALKRGEIAQANELLARALKNAPSHAGASALKREMESLQAQELLIVPSLGAMYKKPINLEFRDASIKMVFDALSRTTGINFIFDREVKGDQRTTVFLKQTTLDDAIDVILSTGQLDKKILNASSVLIYPNTPAKNREYQDLIVKAFYLSNVEAKQAANLLKTVLKIKDVFVDDKYNMLVMRENPETVILAEKLIALHDLEEPEVMLDVEVLEINRSRLLNLGVQWPNQLTIAPLTNSGTLPGTGTSGSSAMKYSDLKALNLDTLGISMPSATINLQKTDGDANLLANPRIRVRDREKAKILIGDKVPVVTTTSSGTFVTENIQYLDVGLKLEVEPDIHLRDEIGLKVALEVSSLVSSIKTNNGSSAYQIGTRNFNSALRLRDGETQVLGGLISDEDRSSANRIPLVGELPILGRLFGSQNDNRQKTEIVLSITPHLIRNIRRKDAASESFWSGTEASLHSRPLQLRNFDAVAGVAAKPAQPAAAEVTVAVTAPPVGTPAVPAPASSPDAPKFTWAGPAQAKVGEVVTLTLNMDSPELLRAVSLQFGFNPAQFELLAVQEGDYFSKAGKASFSQAIDNPGGRASVGSSAGDQSGAKGAGRIVTVTARALAPSQDAGISLISMTPVGSQRAISRPALPQVHRVTVER